MSNPWATTRKPTTLRDEPRTLRERIGARLARRIISEYQHELCAWIHRADAGWETAVANTRLRHALDVIASGEHVDTAENVARAALAPDAEQGNADEWTAERKAVADPGADCCK